MAVHIYLRSTKNLPLAMFPKKANDFSTNNALIQRYDNQSFGWRAERYHSTKGVRE